MTEQIDYTAVEDHLMAGMLGNDCGAWATAFCQHAKKLHGIDLDEGWLAGWFANAMEMAASRRAKRLENEIRISDRTVLVPANETAPAIKITERLRHPDLFESPVVYHREVVYRAADTIERLRDLLGRIVYLADQNPNADGRDLWKTLCEHPDLLPAIDAELETKE